MLLDVLGRQVDRRDAAVGADADVILAADLDGVLDVAEEIFRHRLPLGAEEGHQIDAGDAALLRQAAELFVGLVARQVDESGAGGVGDGDRFLRGGDGVERGLPAAVPEVDQDASSFMRSIISRPRRLRPAFAGSRQPSPTRFRRL